MTSEVEKVEGDLVSFTLAYSCPSWDEPRVSRSTLRFLDASALRSFLADADLAVVDQFGDWDRSPLTEKSPEIIIVAERA
jgi:hypothetical protein